MAWLLISPGSGQNSIVKKEATYQQDGFNRKKGNNPAPGREQKQRHTEFRFNQNSMAFYYSCPVYHSSIRFLVKLDGIDEEWIQTGLPVFKYDRLPWGNYIFHVKAFDGSGNTSKESHFAFVISSPWYWSCCVKDCFIFCCWLHYILAIRIIYSPAFEKAGDQAGPGKGKGIDQA